VIEMKHLLNWIEIPVVDMVRAKRFYSTILGTDLQNIPMDYMVYSIFATEDHYNSGALVQGEYYMPSEKGVLIYLNGGDDLNEILLKIEENGGSVIMPKTFLSDMAGHIGMFIDTEGNRIGVQSMG
jgi:predicted enzyme related to lactoylglutathione lyase